MGTCLNLTQVPGHLGGAEAGRWAWHGLMPVVRCWSVFAGLSEKDCGAGGHPSLGPRERPMRHITEEGQCWPRVSVARGVCETWAWRCPEKATCAELAQVYAQLYIPAQTCSAGSIFPQPAQVTWGPWKLSLRVRGPSGCMRGPGGVAGHTGRSPGDCCWARSKAGPQPTHWWMQPGRRPEGVPGLGLSGRLQDGSVSGTVHAKAGSG